SFVQLAESEIPAPCRTLKKSHAVISVGLSHLSCDHVAVKWAIIFDVPGPNVNSECSSSTSKPQGPTRRCEQEVMLSSNVGTHWWTSHDSGICGQILSATAQRSISIRTVGISKKKG